MKKTRLFAGLLAVCMLFGTGSGALPANAIQQEGSTAAVSYFQNPDYTAKPMARLWFPDATAGIDENDTIEKQIQSLAQAGFGGIEVAMLADSVSYDNEQAKYAGWGTDSWVKLLKKVYSAADAVEGGFVVDLTITAHWPPSVNTIDPNDVQASKEISNSFTKITSNLLGLSSAEIQLPETKTEDGKNAKFLFTDSLISANIAQVTDVGLTEEGVVKYTLDYQTLQAVDTARMTCDSTGVPDVDYRMEEGVCYAGTPAGIPDQSVCDQNGWDYQSVLQAFGPEQSNPDETAKVDQDNNRKRMADWQYRYTADLSSISIEADQEEQIKPGDWVILSSFYRGTGQLMNGGDSVPMYNRNYVMDFFDTRGIQAVFDYWEQNILSDQKLSDMIRTNGGSIFEDSIEANKTTNLWTHDLLDEATDYYGEEYPYRDVLASIVSGERTYGGHSAKDAPDYLDFSNTTDQDGNDCAARIVEDYNLLLGHLYETQHCVPSNEWAQSIGCSYRAQTYDLTGLDIAGASSIVTIPEGDNRTKGDGLRQLSAAVNLNDKKYLSMEAITGRRIYQFNWEDILFELTANFSWGVNRAILHGSAYSKALNGFHADWPGWDPFGGRGFGEPYTYRQAYWDKMEMVSDYIARNQALLQYTTQKIDVAVVRNTTEAYENPSGNSFQDLLDNGYSYNLMSEALLNGPNANLSNGQIYPEGPGYKALILSEVELISVESMQKIVDYAKNGFSVIVYNSHPDRVYGTESDSNNDAAVQALYSELLTYPTVKATADKSKIPDLLASMGVKGYAQYQVEKLETTMYADPVDGSRYYYIFNDVSTFQNMLTAGTGKLYKNGTYGGTIYGAEVTLTGQGTPYFLDANTGEITEAAQYTRNADGSVTVRIDSLAPGTSAIVALTSNTEDFPSAASHVTQVDTESEQYAVVRGDDGTLSLRTNQPGSYAVALSDGKTRRAYVEEALPQLDLGEDNWQLVIDSYGPKYPNASHLVDQDGIQTVDPSETVVTTVDFGMQPLGKWEDIQATPEQLALIGVQSMNEVSGRGYYTRSFEWDGSPAELSFAYGNDQVTGITVNGAELTGINNLTGRIDLSNVLVPGENTITIECTTTLNKRATVESGSITTPTAETAIVYNGLTEVSLTPYTECLLDDTAGADKSILYQVLAYADEQYASPAFEQVIQVVQVSFTDALHAAREVANDPDAEQEAVDQAWKKLMTEIHKLGFVRGDKGSLGKLIDAALICQEQIDLYTPVTAQPFTTQLTSAQMVFSDANAMQDEVSTAEAALLEALVNLRYRADKSILDKLLAQAAEIDTGNYTAESTAVFHTASNAAQSVSSDANATQKQVDAAVKHLREAIDGLIPMSVSMEVQGDSTLSAASANAKTGETAPLAATFAVLMISALGVLIRKRK